MSKPNTPNIPGATVMTDTLDFVKNLWGSMGVPGMNIPGITAPSLSVEDLDKKISDLKAVEAWLNVNMSMLRGTIQALEVQRGTLATLKSMGESFAAAVKQPAPGEKPLFDASAFFPKSGADPGKPDSAQAAAAAQMANPAAWWALLQEQFQQAVTATLAADGGGKAEPGAAAGKAAEEAKEAKGKPVKNGKP